MAPARGLRPSGGGGVDNTNPGAGEGDGFGLARFGEGGEIIRGIAVKVGDPQFTLIWDTDADLDLHVIEPGGKEIYWEEPKGKQGGELDVDNTKGLGPENIYWLVESDGPGSAKVKGPGPAGQYHWFVVYWGGFGGIPKPTHWKVRIKHEGKVTVVNGKFRALNERSRTYTLKVDPPPQCDRTRQAETSRFALILSKIFPGHAEQPGVVEFPIDKGPHAHDGDQLDPARSTRSPGGPADGNAPLDDRFIARTTKAKTGPIEPSGVDRCLACGSVFRLDEIRHIC